MSLLVEQIGGAMIKGSINALLNHIDLFGTKHMIARTKVASLLAKNKVDAIYVLSDGLQGQSYAITLKTFSVLKIIYVRCK